MILVAAAVLGPGGSAMAADQPDVIFLHGKIHTEDSRRTVVQAFALRGNTIISVGSDAMVSALAGASTRTVDLGGRVVLPGIIDAHTHPAQSAQDLGKCSLEDRPVTPLKVRARVAACLRRQPGDRARWFEAVSVNPSGLTLTLKDLDAILPDRPMLLSGSDGHTVWVNSAALEAARITSATPDPAGGYIARNASGSPTGTLRDNAGDLALAAKPAATLDGEAGLLVTALQAMRAAGITSVQDAGVDDHLMQIYKRLYDGRQLNMQVRGSYHLKNLHEPAAVLIEQAVKFRARGAIDPDFLRADAVKVFVDGVIEYPSQTAALLEPYLDSQGRPTGNRGPSYFDQDNLNDIVSSADAAGLTVHIHAIGDRAV